MKLEDIMLSDMSQSPKDKYSMFHLYEVPTVDKFTETEGRMVVPRHGGRRDCGVIV